MSRVQSLASIPTHHGLTAQQKITADQIISCMENNDPILPYAYHEVLNDGRGITCGRSGFTSANGDLLAVIERYTQFSPNNPLTKYLPALTRAAEHESDDVRELVGFEKDWVECVTRDPNLCRAQDDVNDREYYIPSAKIADELGLRLPLSRTVIYDTYIQHGIDPDDNWTKDKDFKDDMDHMGQLIREARRQCGGLPSHNVPERVFLRTFLEVRKKHLLHSADPETRREWRDSVDRIAAFQRLLDAGHVDLVLPLRLIVFDERFYLESDPTKSRKLKPGESFPGTMGLLSNGCGFSSMFSWSIAKFGSFDNETKATQPPSKPNAAAILSQHGQSTVGRLTLSSQAPSASMATIPVFSRTEQSQTPVSSIFDVKEDGPYLGHLTTQQKLTMEQITSCFVHGNKQMQYDACMDIGDGRGLICGRCGSFTSASGTLLHLVERYTTIVPSNPLQRYITILRLLSEAESGETDQLTGFELDWKQVCKDPQMAQIQDELCDRELFIPVCLRADQLGLRSPLAHAILYDTLLEHGGGRSHDSMESIIRHVQREKGVPQPSLDEVRWLRRFLERRRKHMEHPHDHRKRRYWSHCVERLHVFLRMLDHHQMDLSLPLTIRYHGEVYVLERDESLEETTPSRNTRILRPTSHTNGNGHTTHINGTNGGLTIQQKRIAEQLISCFENASPEVQYAYAEDLNDGRGLTCGRCGFTSAHGDLLLVVERYNELSPNNILTKYLPALRSLAKHEDDDTTQLRGFLKDWKVAVQDVNLIQAQDDINDQEYYSVSVRYSDILGLKLPISRAQLYDALIQHGANEDDDLTSEVDDEEDPDSLSQLIRETRHKMKGTPATGVDELTWLRAFLDVRKKHLNNAHLPEARNEWRASIDRVDCFIRLLNENNINLASPLQVTVFGESFTLSA